MMNSSAFERAKMRNVNDVRSSITVVLVASRPHWRAPRKEYLTEINVIIVETQSKR
jgi:hypothetical protein